MASRPASDAPSGEDFFRFNGDHRTPGRQTEAAPVARAGGDAVDPRVDRGGEPQRAAKERLHSEVRSEWMRQSDVARKAPLQVGADNRYTVQPGDCLSTIAERRLRKDGEAVNGKSINQEMERLQKLNAGEHQSLNTKKDFIGDGWKLRIYEDGHMPGPERAPKQAPRPRELPAAPAGPQDETQGPERHHRRQRHQPDQSAEGTPLPPRREVAPAQPAPLAPASREVAPPRAARIAPSPNEVPLQAPPPAPREVAPAQREVAPPPAARIAPSRTEVAPQAAPVAPRPEVAPRTEVVPQATPLPPRREVAPQPQPAEKPHPRANARPQDDILYPPPPGYKGPLPQRAVPHANSVPPELNNQRPAPYYPEGTQARIAPPSVSAPQEGPRAYAPPATPYTNFPRATEPQYASRPPELPPVVKDIVQLPGRVIESVARSVSDWGSFFQGQSRGNNCSAATMAMMDHDWDRSQRRDLSYFDHQAHLGQDGGYYAPTAAAMAADLHRAIPDANFHTNVLENGNRKQVTDYIESQIKQGHTMIVGIMSPYHPGRNNHYIYLAGKDDHGNYLIGDPGNRNGGRLGKTISPRELVDNWIMPRIGGVRIVAGWNDSQSVASRTRGTAAFHYAQAQNDQHVADK